MYTNNTAIWRSTPLKYVLSHFLCAILFKIGLDYAYINIIFPSYAYMGYSCNPTFQSMELSYIFLVWGVLLTIPFFRSSDVFCSNLIILLFYFSYIPTATVLGCVPQPTKFILAISIYYTLFFLLLKIVNKPNIRLYQIRKIIPWVSIFFCALVIIISGVWAHFRINLSFDNVYALRWSARGYRIPTVLVYLWNAASNILPLMVAFYLAKKNYKVVALLAFVILLNFSINGMKATLLKLVLCIIFFFVLKKDPRYYIGYFFVAIMALASVEWLVIGTDMIAETYIRRNFFIPSFFDTLYFDIIEKNGPIFYSHSIGGTEIDFLIGDEYFDRGYMRANNGMFSDAYRNLGMVGVFIYPFVYALLFKTVEAMAKGHAVWVLFFTAFIFVYTIRGAEITVSLLTHGLFFVAIVLYLVPRNYLKE